jgi:hypothetical protein
MSATIKAPAPNTGPYLRGDGAAGNYLGFTDAQGRNFRKWAEARRVPFALVGTVRTYRKRDLDRAWERAAHYLPGTPNP